MKLISTLAITLLVFGCAKEEIKIESQTKEITHNYSYHQTAFKIIYVMNEDDEVVDVKGDVEMLQTIFKDEAATKSKTYLVNETDNQGNYGIHIFDSSDEMDAYQERVLGMRVPQKNTDRQPCTDDTQPGSAHFNFYYHTNYNSEIFSLEKDHVSYFQDQWLDPATENNTISSMRIENGSVDLFSYNCFFGTQIRFTVDIRNLHEIWVTGAGGGSNPDYTGKPAIWHPSRMLWNHNFGDQTSSIKGWSI